MKEIAISEILYGVCDKLHRRKIRKTNGCEFSAYDMLKVIRFFAKEEFAVSITYEVWIYIDGHVYDGYITIWRDGFLEVRVERDKRL